MTSNYKNNDCNLPEFVERLRKRAFDPSCCFLCAQHFDDANLTDEHVIPRWAQKRYNLWNERLTLLNSTTIPYRQLTVPCCEECNKYRLQPIEVSVANAVAQGTEAVRRLGSNILFLWLGKIFYGMLYKELFLLMNRQKHDGLTIVPPDIIRQYENHLFFLQQVREKVVLVDFSPGSFYVFPTQVPEDQELQWDLIDNIDTMFIGIRIGSVGLIGVLGDGGAQMTYEDSYNKFYDFPLHPIQFLELCSHFSYRSSIATRTPKYITIQGEPHQVHQMPLGGLSSKPLFDEWDDSEYSKFLSQYTGVPYDQVFSPPDKVLTWLHNESGDLTYLDLKKHPYY